MEKQEPKEESGSGEEKAVEGEGERRGREAVRSLWEDGEACRILGKKW